MRVFRVPFSTNVERVALVLGHKGIDVDWVDVPYDERSAVLEVSGQELVPVLDADGEVVVDSSRIVEWLEERFPEPPVFPRDEARRAEVRLFVEWFDVAWKYPPNAIEREYERSEPDADKIARNEQRLRDSLPHFEALLAGRDYLYGDFGAADCAAFPFLKYGHFGVPAGDEHRFHAILADTLALAGRYPRVAAWLERVNDHPRVLA